MFGDARRNVRSKQEAGIKLLAELFLTLDSLQKNVATRWFIRLTLIPTAMRKTNVQMTCTVSHARDNGILAGETRTTRMLQNHDSRYRTTGNKYETCERG